jgi:hypothetical protein
MWSAWASASRSRPWPRQRAWMRRSRATCWPRSTGATACRRCAALAGVASAQRRPWVQAGVVAGTAEAGSSVWPPRGCRRRRACGLAHASERAACVAGALPLLPLSRLPPNARAHAADPGWLGGAALGRPQDAHRLLPVLVHRMPAHARLGGARGAHHARARGCGAGAGRRHPLGAHRAVTGVCVCVCVHSCVCRGCVRGLPAPCCGGWWPDARATADPPPPCCVSPPQWIPPHERARAVSLTTSGAWRRHLAAPYAGTLSASAAAIADALPRCCLPATPCRAMHRHVPGLSGCHAGAAVHGRCLWACEPAAACGVPGPRLDAAVAGRGRGDTPQVAAACCDRCAQDGACHASRTLGSRHGRSHTRNRAAGVHPPPLHLGFWHAARAGHYP